MSPFKSPKLKKGSRPPSVTSTSSGSGAYTTASPVTSVSPVTPVVCNSSSLADKV